MASNSGVQQPQVYHSNNPHHCKECGLYLNSAESLEVHLQYHKENLLNKWATQAASSHSEETNNNNTKGSTIKREYLISNTVAAADSSDSMTKKSPEYSRATPETIFGHPPTPQSYQSASSPYQNHENSAFSPTFQNYQQIKTERSSPNYQNNFGNFQDSQFFAVEGMQHQQQYSQDYPVHKTQIQNSTYRYHPYQYDRTQNQPQVSSSSPAYPPQPTPSPSPKQCDKCGFVCESASLLIEHLNIAHPPTPAYQTNQQHFMFGPSDRDPQQIKSEEDAQSEILDLDSHKVHQVYTEEEKRQNNDPNNHNPHSVSALLNNWSPQQQKMFQSEQQRMFMNGGQEQKMFQQNIPDGKMYQPQMHSPDFMGGGVTTTTQDGALGQPPQAYRPFEHLPSQTNAPVISSTQVPTNPVQATPPIGTKSANWKSNEARRPKTYNCTACNKWFTSSGHLKRHYNTTLHKNAVKTSGQPDPATLPISAHHHPARDPPNREDRSSNSPGEESRSTDEGNSMPPHFERTTPMPGMLQQPPNGPYDRQPPNIHNTPPLHSPMGQLTNGSPPNGEAGPSTVPMDSRGLLSLSATQHQTTPHGFTMAPPPPMMPMEGNQFQMYPNGSAPHVTQQAMVINSLSTIGEIFSTDGTITTTTSETQPLPSFAQIHANRCGLLLNYGNANVGGGGPVTAPYTYYQETVDALPMESKIFYREDGFKLTVLTPSEPVTTYQEDLVLPYPPSPAGNDENADDNMVDEDCKMHVMDDIKMRLEAQPASPEKAHIKRDYEESTGSPLISSTMPAKQTGTHKCFDCDKLFNKACYLTQHNKTFHSGDKPFKCTRCGKRFSCELTYQEHHSKHAGDKPHKCDLCPKQFNHKTDLRRHMCLHTGQKPYACDTCGKGFIRKDHMLKHCETHVRKAQIKSSGVR